MNIVIDDGLTARFQIAFAEAERAAYRDRQRGVTRAMPPRYCGESARGWMAGYWPRCGEWAATKPKVVPVALLPQECAL